VRIYLAALLEAARKTPIGKAWKLDRDKVMVDLTITDARFDELLIDIERRLPGKWQKVSAPDRMVLIYLRLE
jgi:hypothetical protein